jgi:mono/diheme cytochrome c family protein
MRTISFVLALIVLAACGATTVVTDPLATGGRVFTIQCAACHAISDSGPDALGPRLTSMVARANAQPDPEAWLRTSIIDPNIEIAPGYQAGLMPVNYGQSLRPDQLDALVTYMLTIDE